MVIPKAPAQLFVLRWSKVVASQWKEGTPLEVALKCLIFRRETVD